MLRSSVVRALTGLNLLYMVEPVHSIWFYLHYKEDIYSLEILYNYSLWGLALSLSTLDSIQKKKIWSLVNKIREVYLNIHNFRTIDKNHTYLFFYYWHFLNTKRALFLRYEKKYIYRNAITFRCHISKNPAPRRNYVPCFH